jgi:hypothetical protein
MAKSEPKNNEMNPQIIITFVRVLGCMHVKTEIQMRKTCGKTKQKKTN